MSLRRFGNDGYADQINAKRRQGCRPKVTMVFMFNKLLLQHQSRGVSQHAIHEKFKLGGSQIAAHEKRLNRYIYSCGVVLSG